MPDSQPNDFGQSTGGDVTSQYLLGSEGFPGQNIVMNWGLVNPFIGGSFQTDVMFIAHGLGVVPKFVAVSSGYTDGGRFIGQLYKDGGFNAVGFGAFWWDWNLGAHGPGNLGAVFNWWAIG